MKTSYTVTNPTIFYSQLSNVRKFLRQFARPSTLSELIETTEDSPEWHDLVVRVYAEITGTEANRVSEMEAD
jgi:hypothetical protein